jgi:putative modified peptide
MSDATLTNAQCAMLIKELATNDEFRRRYEQKPAAALVELGVPYHTVMNLNPACLAPRQLADKETFQAAQEQLGTEATRHYLSMTVPKARIGSGKE